MEADVNLQLGKPRVIGDSTDKERAANRMGYKSDKEVLGLR